MDPTASLMNPMGPRPRVLPAGGFPHNVPQVSSPPPHSSNGQARPPPIVPRRTHRHPQAVDSSMDYPGRMPDGNARMQAQAPSPSQRNPIYSGASSHATKVVTELSSVQLQEEVHLLRVRVEDQAVEVNKKERDLQYCHEQLKQLTTQLTEKKEELLKSEDRVVSLQADLSETRENMLAMQRNGNRSQPLRATSSESEMALRREVEHLNGMLDEECKQREYYSQQLEKDRAKWKHQVMQHEEEIRRYEDQLRDLQRHNQQLEQQQYHQQQPHYPQHPQPYMVPPHMSEDIKSRMQMLEAQVLIYKEDFEKEREDRTRAQDSIITLKDEIASLQKANELLINERALQPQPRQR